MRYRNKTIEFYRRIMVLISALRMNKFSEIF